MYYAVVPYKYDNLCLMMRTRKGKKFAGILVGGELITYKEYLRLRLHCDNMPRLDDHWVKLPKSQVCWFFGARLPLNEYETGDPVPYTEVYARYETKPIIEDFRFGS